MSSPKAVIVTVDYDDKNILVTGTNHAATVAVSIARSAMDTNPGAVTDLLTEMPYIVARRLARKDGAS